MKLLRGLAVAAVFFAASATAHAQSALAICTQGAPVSVAENDASLSLAASAQSAEQLLEVGGREAAETAQGVLEQAGTRVEVVTNAARARFCAAYGEAARRGASGGVGRAQIALRTALASAESASVGETSAIAAYRLALSLMAGGGVGDRTGESAQFVEPIEENDGSACQAALAVDPTTRAASPLRALECAAHRASQSGNERLAALAVLRRARLALGRADNAPNGMAEVMRQRAVNDVLAFLSSPDGEELENDDLRGRLVEVALDAGGGADARASSSIEAMRGAQLDTEAFKAALKARAAYARGANADAVALIRQAIFVESTRPIPERLPDWFMLLATFEPASRGEHVADAYRALQTIRPLMPLYDPVTEESEFARHQRPVFEAAVENELANAGGDAEMLARAQRIVEDYREAELQSAFGNECVPPRVPVRPRDLAAGEIVIYPILLQDRVEILAAWDASGFRRLAVNRSHTRSTITALANEFSRTTARPTRGQPWARSARLLYDVLIAPIEDQLPAPNLDNEDAPTLIVLPDGLLRGVPLAALQDSAGHFLIERARVVVAPALAYTQPGRPHTHPSRVVAAALSQQVDLAEGRFPALMGTQAEARTAKAWGDAERSTLLEGDNFTEVALREALAEEPADVLHLATHASFAGRSEQSYIVARGGVIRMAELRHMIAENRVRGHELDLLVLSACETAKGDDAASMGLAGAAIQAGAVSALASLWPVNDASTATLMRNFYEAYRRQSKAEALRRAQAALIRTPNFSDPYYWAAFALVGGWR